MENLGTILEDAEERAVEIDGRIMKTVKLDAIGAAEALGLVEQEPEAPAVPMTLLHTIKVDASGFIAGLSLFSDALDKTRLEIDASAAVIQTPTPADDSAAALAAQVEAEAAAGIEAAKQTAEAEAVAAAEKAAAQLAAIPVVITETLVEKVEDELHAAEDRIMGMIHGTNANIDANGNVIPAPTVVEPAPPTEV